MLREFESRTVLMRNKEKYNEYMNEYMKDRYHKRRTEAIEYLGGKCIDCGATECLELDHKDMTTKSFPISKMSSINEKDFWSEVNKCQLMCKECHQKKTIEERKFNSRHEHGTAASYRYSKCRCEKCKKAKSEEQKRYRENKKNKN